jgi:hypothetical protein
VLDLAVEIESLPREMPTSIQQYQVVGMSSPLNPRSTKILGSLHLNAVTAQDAGTNVTSALVGIDEENFLVIENRAGTKWWWLVHTKLREPERVCGRLGRILLPGGREVKRGIGAGVNHGKGSLRMPSEGIGLT